MSPKDPETALVPNDSTASPATPAPENRTTLYERVVGSGDIVAPPARVIGSSAVVLWRRDDAGVLEVFWMRRDPRMRFMGGWYAFPGGGVSRSDTDADLPLVAGEAGRPRGLSATEVTGELPEALTAGLDLAPDGVDGLVAATLRELFEETGLLLARDGATMGTRRTDDSGGPSADRVADARRRLLAKEASFAGLVAELEVELDASPLVFAGRWLTPPFAPVRFDNRFFLLEYPAGLPEPRDCPEAVEAEWVRPAEAVERWRRGELMAAPPILYLLEALAEVEAGDGGIPEDVIERLRRPVDANLGPHRRVEFRPGVLMFPLPTPTLPPATHTNCYLLGRRDCVLVDPGTPYPEDIDRLAAALEVARERLGRRVVAIWLTHHHPDHVGAVEDLAKRLAVPVAGHPETARLLALEGLAVELELHDGQRVELDAGEDEPSFWLRVVHTPGHAPGHVCFLDERGRSLVAGDMVSTVSTIVVDPPAGDMDEYLTSLELLAAHDPKTLMPGHGPVILDGKEKLRQLREHRLWREERILEAWTDGLRRPEEMLERVYDDAPKKAWPLAARQILAHLERLERAGRLDEEDDGAVAAALEAADGGPTGVDPSPDAAS